jgi:hypothetical protein
MRVTSFIFANDTCQKVARQTVCDRRFKVRRDRTREERKIFGEDQLAISPLFDEAAGSQECEFQIFSSGDKQSPLRRSWTCGILVSV